MIWYHLTIFFKGGNLQVNAEDVYTDVDDHRNWYYSIHHGSLHLILDLDLITQIREWHWSETKKDRLGRHVLEESILWKKKVIMRSVKNKQA
jgi:hypothetical protein